MQYSGTSGIGATPAAPYQTLMSQQQQQQKQPANSFRRTKDVMMVSVIMDVVLLNLLAISIAANVGDASVFTFPWTYRMGALDQRNNVTSISDGIVSMYESNRDSSPEHLGSMMHDILGSAWCIPVDYDGGLRFDAGDISSTCK